ncbi:TIGR04222 domain-containing membrane protein [Streptomyces sp. NPDC052676]|uniref:TIGR04222 domain-containing membrane protein n=1 Tax=Streptomyces sp. NPDC052676 TaxID=3154953 RepID=UPI0034415FC8
MSDGTAAPAPHEIALLRSGPHTAVTVAPVALHPRGVVEPGPPGTVRAVPRDAATAELPPAFEDVVHSALDRPLRPHRLVRHPDVRPAVALTRVPLAEAGLPSRPFLGPTRFALRAGLPSRVEVADVRGTRPPWGLGGAAPACGGGDGGGSDHA